MDLNEKIKNYIKENVLTYEIDFSDSDSLFDLNILNSLAIIQLIAYFTEHLNYSIDPSEIIIEDFETINSIVSYLQTKEPQNV